MPTMAVGHTETVINEPLQGKDTEFNSQGTSPHPGVVLCLLK